jgi:hypothetical protein
LVAGSTVPATRHIAGTFRGCERHGALKSPARTRFARVIFARDAEHLVMERRVSVHGLDKLLQTAFVLFDLFDGCEPVWQLTVQVATHPARLFDVAVKVQLAHEVFPRLRLGGERRQGVGRIPLGRLQGHGAGAQQRQRPELRAQGHVKTIRWALGRTQRAFQQWQSQHQAGQENA